MVRFNVRNVLTMEIFRQKGSDMEEKHQTLKELPVSERPYEKCEKNGTAMLSDAELLAVILRSGTRIRRRSILQRKCCRLIRFMREYWEFATLQEKNYKRFPGLGK